MLFAGRALLEVRRRAALPRNSENVSSPAFAPRLGPILVFATESPGQLGDSDVDAGEVLDAVRGPAARGSGLLRLRESPRIRRAANAQHRDQAFREPRDAADRRARRAPARRQGKHAY